VAAVTAFLRTCFTSTSACNSAVAGFAGIVGRTTCSSAKITKPAKISLPRTFIYLSILLTLGVL
jgi:hypothetical protein